MVTKARVSPITVSSNAPALANGHGSESMLEIQRGRILAAMVEACAQCGAANVSVSDVVTRAGISRRTFYEIFADREECFLAAFDDGMEGASRYALDGYDPSAPWVLRVRTALAGLLTFFDVERGVGQLLIVGSLGAGPRALERRRHVLTQIVTVVEEGRKQAKAVAELPPLTAEGLVGGVIAVLHSRILEEPPNPLLALTGPLMSMLVLPYLGQAAARKELARPTPRVACMPATSAPNPLRELGMRLTYRTVRVLLAVAATPGGSNRQVADAAGISDQGQISKLVTRLHGLGLIENTGAGSARGAPNSWVLTDRGWDVQRALAGSAA
jgi:AcrR family transcriptional regulator